MPTCIVSPLSIEFHIFLISIHLAVHVNLTSTSVTVDENDPGSVVCVSLEGALGNAQNITATLMIGSKVDATDPATGIMNGCTHTCNCTQTHTYTYIYTFTCTPIGHA